jgi:hypothetical protein
VKKRILLGLLLLLVVNQNSASFIGAAQSVKSHIVRYKREYALGGIACIEFVAAVFMVCHANRLERRKPVNRFRFVPFSFDRV